MPKRKGTTKAKPDVGTTAKRAKKEPKSGKSSGSDAAFDLLQYLKEPGWKNALSDEFSSDYFEQIQQKLGSEYNSGKEIFPPKEQIFNAFNSTPFNKVKVVILGQDPYHDVGQAHGLCFSVAPGVKPPPSLKNIYKELSSDIPGFVVPDHGCLQAWADRGVLLMNATLTVEAHKANSHASIGWQKLTDAAIKALNDSTSGIVFILWGGFAQKKASMIDGTKHGVIQAAHPSPLSVTKFRGCKCFSETNDLLKSFGKAPVDWSLPPLKGQSSMAQFLTKK